MSDSDKNPSPEWIPPTVEELHALLPQYEISAVLGRGGMGAVYQGCQTNLKRNVAIKILPESLGGEESDDPHQFVERFKLEAQSMANLDHPAILSVYDFGETSDGQLYLVMEFIDGMDIQKYLHHHGGKLVHEHAIAITAHVLDALQYAHDHGVVHRDIKPANVLINSEGRVKIADFGLAKRLTQSEGDEGEPASGLTSANVVMGTPDFVAPEALEMGTNPDGRSDLYSVGVMFYQMLTGKLPRGQFELPSVLNPVLDPRFDAVVSKALQANPDSRYGSATEFRRELDGLLTKPVPKAADTRSEKAPAATKGKRIPVQSRLPYPRPKLAEPKKSKAPLLIGLVLGAVVVIGVGMVAMKRSNSGEETEVVQVEPPPKPTPEPAPTPENFILFHVDLRVLMACSLSFLPLRSSVLAVS
jgi:serine/threonine protein kinase